ncbi:hydroxyisourate hydrolase [Pseudonocardia oroxyli]|uniref:5-hydroxyisourate hydrolase n=1 Tax=Pseudonocardia oroxyli TaxID=366584 RepID=A0A1G7WHT2_PSEOR|nr:hydroxyisourate hydrolase [Pseudonocardia oroxyli]SDG71512.1 5-hydroxyisourate hydrolase [Pseudonocardia oroxyli]
MSLSTHVLDATSGTPAAGMVVVLRTGGRERDRIVTDADGRGRLAEPGAGVHTLTFATAAWSPFYPEVTVAFTVTDPARHHHVPLLLSPFAYSTYRGS